MVSDIVLRINVIVDTIVVRNCCELLVLDDALILLSYYRPCVLFKLLNLELISLHAGIRSIPTVMIFKGGKKMDTIIGAVPKATLVQTIEKYL